MTPSRIWSCSRRVTCRPPIGKQTERRRGGGPVDEVRAQVLGERREVVLPDRLVDAEQRENDVSGGPDGGAERESVPHARVALGAEQQPVPRARGEAEPPVRGVVEDPRVPRREVALEHGLEQPLRDERRCRGVLPGGKAFRGLPSREGSVAAVVAVTAIERRVHRKGAGRTRGDAANGRTHCAHDPARAATPAIEPAPPSLRASIAAMLLSNALRRTPFPTVPSRRPRNRPLRFLPSRTTT